MYGRGQSASASKWESFFFLSHHQAQLIADRDYGAEFSTHFPDSIAIVVVKRTAILF
jgi:hypothetical protein